MDTRFCYKVQLLNMSSFMEIAAFIELLRNKLKVEFLAYSVNKFGSHSDYSQHWELQFQTNNCLAMLVDVHGIYWDEHQILVHHVTTHKQPRCLICGVSGHFARECKTPAVDLKVTNYLMLPLAEVQAQKKPAETFTSVQEMNEAFQIPMDSVEETTSAKPRVPESQEPNPPTSSQSVLPPQPQGTASQVQN